MNASPQMSPSPMVRASSEGPLLVVAVMLRLSIVEASHASVAASLLPPLLPPPRLPLLPPPLLLPLRCCCRRHRRRRPSI